MRNISELPSTYLKFANMITTQFLSKIKILRTDNTMEYKESSLTLFYLRMEQLFKGLALELHLKNGRAERKHRHILDIVRAFFISFSCPEIF